MVSNVLGMDADDLLATLQRLGREYANDPDYTGLRAELPADWPI
jgi:hypothetical protein